MVQKEIEEQLAAYKLPYLHQDVMHLKALKSINIEEKRVLIDIVLSFPFASIKAEIISQLKALIQPVVPDKAVEIRLILYVDSHSGKEGISPLSGVKNIIAVASGKGGVGKSTIAVNLALALAREGAAVGLLDADIYGPSQPTMLGTAGQKPVVEERKLLPIEQHGIQSMSIGYLVEANAAMVWRGPMIGKAMEQMLQDTAWKGLDYLIVDLPPGTGDVQLTLCQKMPVTGALIVTTPQDLALLDVKRACEMFRKLNVPILGVVENMSVFHCRKCGHAEAIFGAGGAQKLAAEYHLKQLGVIPLDLQIRELTDKGTPPVLQGLNNSAAQAFSALALSVAAELSLLPKNYSAKFPKIVIAPK